MVRSLGDDFGLLSMVDHSRRFKVIIGELVHFDLFLLLSLLLHLHFDEADRELRSVLTRREMHSVGCLIVVFILLLTPV